MGFAYGIVLGVPNRSNESATYVEAKERAIWHLLCINSQRGMGTID
jgi:hypothetical protein